MIKNNIFPLCSNLGLRDSDMDIFFQLEDDQKGRDENSNLKAKKFFFTASIFIDDESGYRLLSKYTNKYHLRLQSPLLLMNYMII